MKNVSEVSIISGVSVRTLHYYDEIGLLKPTKRTDSGYRLYDDKAIKRLKTILMYKELEFPLETISRLIDSNDNDALIKEQIKLLKQKQKHFDDLIQLANNMLKGESIMDFSKFDSEVKQRWGDTKEYAEFQKRGNKNDCSEALMQKFIHLGKIKDLSIESEEVKTSIFAIKDFISQNYYECSSEMFLNLGEMYVLDERFKKNIDSVGGDGTAEFANKAIKYYFA